MQTDEKLWARLRLSHFPVASTFLLYTDEHNKVRLSLSLNLVMFYSTYSSLFSKIRTYDLHGFIFGLSLVTFCILVMN